MSRTVTNIFLLTGLKIAGLLLSLVLIMLQTAVLGAGPMADAYFLVRRLILTAINMAGEASNQLLVPDFARRSTAIGTVTTGRTGATGAIGATGATVGIGGTGAASWAPKVIGRGGLSLIALAVLIAGAVAIFAPAVVALLAPGFDPERSEMAVHLLRIVAICLPLSMIGGVAGAFNFSRRRFGITTLARMVPRIALVLVLLTMAGAAGPVALSWALVAGVAVSTAIVVWTSLREAARLPGSPTKGSEGDEGARTVALDTDTDIDTDTGTEANSKVAPHVTSHLVARHQAPRQDPRQRTRARAWAIGINVVAQMAMGWLDAGLASMAGVGAVTVLFVAQRLLSSAPGAVNSSVTAVFYTEYSHGAATLDRVADWVADQPSDRASDTGKRPFPNPARDAKVQVAAAVRISLLVVLPLALFILLAAEPLVRLLLERGAFTPADTKATAELMRFLSPVLLINAVLAAFVTATLADARLPLVRVFLCFASVTLGLRLLLGLVLVPVGGLAGLALAIILSSVAGATVLGVALSRFRGRLFRPHDQRALATMFGAAMLGAGAAAAVGRVFNPGDVAGVVGMGAALLAVYLLVCTGARLPEMMALKRIALRKWRRGD